MFLLKAIVRWCPFRMNPARRTALLVALPPPDKQKDGVRRLFDA
jgi:hypothetical protein